MASGTVYGNQVSNWRAYCDWWTEEDNTSVTIYCRPGMQSLSWGFNLTGIDARANIGGSTKDGSGDFYSARGATVSTAYLTHSVKYNKEKTSKSIDVYGKITNATGYQNGTSTAYVSVPVAALASYTVAYNANGGSGAPSNQIKWYNESLTLSSTTPSKTGYTFQGWGTSSTATAVSYKAGSSYTSNSGITLYAIWKANTYTIAYDANGGSGAPSSQTKTYGVNLTLSSTKPTRTNYNFVGWGLSASATSASYSPGGTYSANSAATLYAIWSLAYLVPRINSVSISRCNSDGTSNDTGSYAKVAASWATDKAIKSISISVNSKSYSVNVDGKSTSGSISQIVGDGKFDSETNYTLTITVTDQIGSNSYSSRVSATNYILDFTPNGSACFGGPAQDNIYSDNAAVNGKQMLTANMLTKFKKNICGISESKNFGDTWQWIMFARSIHNTGSSSEKGWIHITGEMGPWTGMYPVDILVNFRSPSNSDDDANEYQVISNCDPAKGNTRARIIVTKDSSNRICVWGAFLSYASYNLYLSGGQTEIVVSDYVTSSETPSGHTALYNSGNSNTYGTYGSIMACLSKEQNGARSGYFGFKSCNNSNDYIRTTSNGIIPYESMDTGNKNEGHSKLGTDGWPFHSVVTHRLYTDYISANTSTNLNHSIKFYWGDSVTDPCGFGGEVCQVLWEGTLSAGSEITINTLYKYNIFIVYLYSVTTPLFCYRQPGSKNTRVNVADIAGGGCSPFAETYSQKNVANNIGSVLLRATASNKITLRAGYVVQQNESANWIEARAVTKIIGVI